MGNIFDDARNSVLKNGSEYQNAVNTVCLMCVEDTLNGNPCYNCPIRKSVDYWVNKEE